MLRDDLGELDFVLPMPYTRIGHLMDGIDHWWKKDPDGPAQLSEAIKTYGLPFFDPQHSLESQAIAHGRAGTGSWSFAPSRLILAMTLYRLGERDEARRCLDNPKSSMRRFPEGLAQVETLKAWLDAQT